MWYHVTSCRQNGKSGPYGAYTPPSQPMCVKGRIRIYSLIRPMSRGKKRNFTHEDDFLAVLCPSEPQSNGPNGKKGLTKRGL